MENIVFLLLAISTTFYFLYEVFGRLRLVRRGRADNRFDHATKRWKYFGKQVILSKKIRKYPFFGLAHGLIMWGFVVSLGYSINMVLLKIFGVQIPLLDDFAVFVFIRDVFISFVIAGVVICICRRLFKKPDWLNSNGMSFVILALITAVVGSEWLFYTVRNDLFWWIHFLAIFAFLLLIPNSKHLHLVFAPLNTYWHTLEPKGALQPLRLEGNNWSGYGVKRLEDFTWKQLFDSLSCVKCGRCNGSCPSFLSGEELKPKRIHGRMRKHIEKKAGFFDEVRKNHDHDKDPSEKRNQYNEDTLPAKTNHDKKNKKNKEHNGGQISFINDIIDESLLWKCTACGACEEACPVSCEHMSKIMDIRRYYVSGNRFLVPTMNSLFQNIAERGNPEGIKRSLNRGYAWAKEMGIPTLRERPDAEYLYFVGCAPSLEPSALNTAVSFAKILKKAGVNFAVLGEEEWCCGETVRRMGNELLFQRTVRRNIALWHELGVKKILTACPHCFNTLQNEYTQFGGDYQVIHHAVFLADLLRLGKLGALIEQDLKLTYHDPCYLSRHNSCYKEPRQVLQTVSGINLVEMPRNRENSFCCGAGGGRFWLDARASNVISDNRVREAKETGAKMICTACPYCRVVLQDGISKSGLAGDINTMDMAEVLLLCIEESDTPNVISEYV